jgi:hypothetical protein
MNMEIAARYRQLRAEGATARHAFDLIRNEQRPTAYRWLDKLDIHNPVHGTVGPFTVNVSIQDDEYNRLGEDDITGTFSDERTPDSLRNTHRDWSTDYAWYHPSNYARDHYVDDNRRNGASKQVAREQAAARLRQDMADDAARAYYGVVVSVTCNGSDLAGESLWGIDVGPGNDGHSYFVEVAEDLISGALIAARTAVPAEIARVSANLAALHRAAAPTVSLEK